MKRPLALLCLMAALLALPVTAQVNPYKDEPRA
jgi:hypothetical protein